MRTTREVQTAPKEVGRFNRVPLKALGERLRKRALSREVHLRERLEEHMGRRRQQVENVGEGLTAQELPSAPVAFEANPSALVH